MTKISAKIVRLKKAKIGSKSVEPKKFVWTYKPQRFPYSSDHFTREQIREAVDKALEASN